MNYVAVIGDVKESKKINERFMVQEKLSQVLKHVNEKYEYDISAKFIITLGDEFQGLLENSKHLLDIIQYIQREMYPIKLRFGVGIGEIHTNILPEAAIGADGPAYYAARKTIEELREQEKKLKKQAPDVQVSVYKQERFEVAEINIILTFMKLTEESWSEKQRYTIWDMLLNGGSQEECARRLDTTQSTVARRLAEGNMVTYCKAKDTVDEALNRLEELLLD